MIDIPTQSSQPMLFGSQEATLLEWAGHWVSLPKRLGMSSGNSDEYACLRFFLSCSSGERVMVSQPQ